MEKPIDNIEEINSSERINNMEIFCIENRIELQKSAGRAVSELLQQFKGSPTLLLLSGGSAFEILDDIDMDNFNPNLTVTMLDERFTRDKEFSNFGQLAETMFYKVATVRGCNFIDTTPKADETLVESADHFDKLLRGWISANPSGKIIAVMGMGADGHTAGIMPYPEDDSFFKDKFQSDNFVVGYDAGEKSDFSERITTTSTFIKDKLDGSFCYFRGATKSKAFNNMLSDGKLSAVPARIFKEIKNVKIFTDIKT